MKQIINGKRYDTDTAKQLNEWDNNYGRRDFHWCHEVLYQKKTGEFFIYGEGGPASQYAERVGNSGWASGERIMPLTYEEAQKWAEDHLDADEYEEIFGEVAEDDSKMITSFYLPVGTVEKLRRISQQTGISQSDLISAMVDKFQAE